MIRCGDLVVSKLTGKKGRVSYRSKMPSGRWVVSFTDGKKLHLAHVEDVEVLQGARCSQAGLSCIDSTIGLSGIKSSQQSFSIHASVDH